MLLKIPVTINITIIIPILRKNVDIRFFFFRNTIQKPPVLGLIKLIIAKISDTRLKKRKRSPNTAKKIPHYRESLCWYHYHTLSLVSQAKRPPEIDKVIDRIRRIRNGKSISIMELETRSGISHSFIYYIENKKKSPSLETLYKLSKGLGVKMVDFFID
jgi:ribosome-binding protein aMBF1 (putative translation factor)